VAKRAAQPESCVRRAWRSLFLAAALAVSGTVAFAAGDLRAPSTPSNAIDCGSVPLPPERFDHPSLHRVIVLHMPFGLIDNACRARGVLAPTAFIGSNGTLAMLDQVAGNGFEIQACSWTSGDDRYVLLPQVGTGGITKDFNACALRHEIGHLNGWPASHPDARFGSLSQAEARLAEAQSLGGVAPASFDLVGRLRPVRLLSFPRTGDGLALRREMRTRQGFAVTVTEIRMP
jgi:hypothetical protein